MAQLIYFILRQTLPYINNKHHSAYYTFLKISKQNKFQQKFLYFLAVVLIIKNNFKKSLKSNAQYHTF